MNKRNFLKLSTLSIAGLTLNKLSAFNLFESRVNSLEYLDFSTVKPYLETEIIDKNSTLWFGWLARLAISSIVTALGAKVVDKIFSEPVCSGGSCSIKKGKYSDYDGVYGYNKIPQKFYKQNVEDKNVSFQNISVPFIIENKSSCGAIYQNIVKIEGPYLAGLCKMIEHMKEYLPLDDIRNASIPTKEIKDGGYRFDSYDCSNNNVTEFKTNFGTTSLTYDKSNKVLNSKIWNSNNVEKWNYNYYLHEA